MKNIKVWHLFIMSLISIMIGLQINLSFLIKESDNRTYNWYKDNWIIHCAKFEYDSFNSRTGSFSTVSYATRYKECFDTFNETH